MRFRILSLLVLIGICAPVVSAVPPPPPNQNVIILRAALMDRHALSIGPMHGATYEEIAEKLVRPAQNDAEKARVLYRWIAEHIAYDVDSFKNYLDGIRLNSTSARLTLKHRKSVCNGYANLYEAMGIHVGLDVKSISGYGIGWSAANNPDQKPVENHAWNAVRVGGRWYLLDVTWGAGHATRDLKFVRRFKSDYFFTPPEKFYEKHKPTNPIWSLLKSRTFRAPVIEREKNKTIGARLLSAPYEDLHIELGQSAQIVMANDQTLSIGGWLSAKDSSDIMAKTTTYVRASSTPERLTYTITPTQPGRYKFWIGARKASDTGPLPVVFEHTIIVKP